MVNLWANETHPGYGTLAVKPVPYLSRAQNLRAERLRQARMLFEGRHRQYFLDEPRSQFDFPAMEVNGQTIRPYAALKLLRLLSYKSADLIFGEKASLSCDNAIKQMYLDELAKRSKVHSRFHAAAVQASWAGGACLLSCLWREKSYIMTTEPEEIFPEGSPNPDDQFESYLLCREATVGPEDQPIRLLLETHYGREVIERRVRQLDPDGQPLRDLSLDLWPGPEKDLPPRESTGVGENLVTWIPNEIDGKRGVSDYDGLIGSQDSVNAAMTQIARVIAQHSDPFLALPDEAFDQDGVFRLKNKAISFRSKDQIPTYITWDAQLTPAQTDRQFRLNAFCIEAEMSQVLLGIKEGAAPDAARKLRLEATNSLAKAKRKTLNLEPAIQRALEIALRLDRDARVAAVAFPDVPVGVEMHDGLPIDDLDEANVVATYRGAGAMSLEDAVERRKRDPKATAEEVERIRKEKAAATPSILMDESGEGAETGEAANAGGGE
ncbi:MAG: phage portal protein [Bacillota bacterium]